MINDWLAALTSWLAEQSRLIFTPAFFWQIGLFLAALLVGGLLSWWLKARVNRLRQWLAGQPLRLTLPWLDGLLVIFQQSLGSLTPALLSSGAVAVLAESGRPFDLLNWLTLFLYLLFAYQMARAFVSYRFNAQRAAWLETRLLRPLLLSLATLHLLGIFDRLFNLGFNISDNRVTLGGLLTGFFIFYLFFILSRESRVLLKEAVLPRAGVDPSLGHVLAILTGYFLVVSGFLLALGVVGIPLTAFTVIAGGLSVGIGFGLQELISNFVSGFILLFERSIVPGDVIQVGETFGTVEHIGIRATSVRDRNNVELIVPNSRFLSDEVTNFTRSDSRVRLRISVGVSYDADPHEVEQALLAAADHPLLLSEPEPGVLFADFGDSSLDFDLLVWTEQPILRARISSDLRYNIWYALKERDITIPFPQRDIHVRSLTLPPMAGSRPEPANKPE